MNPYILIGITFFNLIILILFRYFYPRKMNLKIQRLSESYKNQVSDFEKEIQRQQIVLKDYKQKLNFSTDPTEKKISNFIPENNSDTLQDILSDQQMLEKEKEAFKIKNQKLWEQSLAVYKEKERIDSIRKYIESQHTNLTHSINYALRIQEALLPSEELLKQFFPNHFIFYRPRDIVSGDFYWTRKIDNKTIIVAADCTGHGVPGAFMSLLGISYLNEIASTDCNFDAAEILEQMRHKIKVAFQQDDSTNSIQDGMDMVVCIVDEETRELDFAGANNGIFISKNDGSLVEIKGTRSPISYYRKEKPFQNHKIILEANESVFMYSDGYFDQFGGAKKQKINRSRFSQILKDCLAENLPITEYKKRLEDFLDDWQGDEIQIDDILVFGITFFTE